STRAHRESCPPASLLDGPVAGGLARLPAVAIRRRARAHSPQTWSGCTSGPVRLVTGRMARWREGALEVLARVASGGNNKAHHGASREVALARRARLPGDEERSRA